MTSMIVGRLHVSFDRGVRRNSAPDLGLEEAPTTTEDGGLVRGLGSHFRSEEARDNAKRLGKEEARIREAFRRTFVASPIPGIYVLPERGAGRQALVELNVDPAVAAGVTEYELALTEAMPPVEIMEWADRVQRQLADVPLGKSKAAGSEGLVTLATLAKCPVLDDETREEILSLIADAKLEAITRVELKREIEFLDVKLAAPIAPRRVPAIDGVDEVGPVARPRRTTLEDIAVRSEGVDDEAAA